MLDNQRDLFDIPDDVAYLNCAYMGPQMKTVTAAGDRASRRKASPWTISAQDFFTDSERLRVLAADLFGAGADDIAIVPSASYGLETAALNARVTRGDRIVMLDEQFPSNVYPWRALAAREGANVVTVARPDDGDWTTAVLREVERGAAIVALPQAHWTDGSRIDVDAVGAACRHVGAMFVLDLTQSLGAAPFSVARARPDFAVAAGYKWLLGPYSLAYLYVAPQYQQGRPLENNWIAREGSENFAGLVNYRDGFQAGARRFDVGERSNFALLPMAIAALSQILDWTVAEIAETIRARTDRIAAGAAELGAVVPEPDQRSSHLVGLRFPGGIPPDLPAKLVEAGVYVSVRGASIRVAPHVYNNDDDINRLLGVIARV